MPSAIAFVTKSWGPLRVSSWVADLPLTGTLTTVQKVYFWYTLNAYRIN
jgi:hypothetical protein